MVLLILVCRLAQIQIAEHQSYRKLGLQQQIIKRSLSARRGNIYDTEGRQLATSVKRASVFADPSAIQEPDAVVKGLSAALHLKPAVLRRKLASGGQFVWVKRQISDADAHLLRRQRHSGVHFRKEYRRTYPEGRTAAHVVGFTDIDGRGLAGIELELDGLLRGRPGREQVACDAARRIIRTADDEPLQIPEDGCDVYLTIDSYIQNIVRQELCGEGGAVQKHEPEAAWALVLDSRTAAILAMVVWPDFDPDSPAASDVANQRNRCVADVYEFGSVMKPFTVAAAVEEAVVSPETQFQCHSGAWRIGRRTVHDVHPYGLLSVSDIITKSSNIGAAQVGLSLGVQRLHHYLRGFGFGRPTGIALPGESSSIIRPVARWNRHSLVSISFGHEYAVSPLSVACAFNVFANGGRLLRPQIVRKVTESGSGRLLHESAGPEVVRQVVSGQTARQVLDMLSRVVEEGTGRRAKLQEYSVAGKTGTAQLIRPDGRGYSTDRYLASFVGIAPAEEPRVVVLVSLKAPRRNGYYGGVAAAPTCREIIRRTLRYLKVPPRQPSVTVAEIGR